MELKLAQRCTGEEIQTEMQQVGLLNPQLQTFRMLLVNRRQDQVNQQCCRRLRQRWDMTGVPVIMVTGLDDPASIDQAYEAGANDFVAKPINWPILGRRARQVLRSAQAVRQLCELREKQGAVMRAIPDMIFVIDWQGTYLDYKPGSVRTSVRFEQRFLGKNISALLPPDASGLVQQAIDAALLSGKLQSVIYSLPLEGEIHYHEARVVPDGVDKVVIVVRDMTAGCWRRGRGRCAAAR